MIQAVLEILLQPCMEICCRIFIGALCDGCCQIICDKGLKTDEQKLTDINQNNQKHDTGLHDDYYKKLCDGADVKNKQPLSTAKTNYNTMNVEGQKTTNSINFSNKMNLGFSSGFQ